MRMDECEKIYQFRRISRRLEIEVIHAKPIFGNVEFERVCPIVNMSRDLGISSMCEDEDSVVMKVGSCKGEQNLEVIGRPFVPVRNIR